VTEGFGRETVMRTTGITYRQLDYWARTGLLRPSIQDAAGSGSRRRYSFQDILQLRIMKRLLDAGISLQQIRSAVKYLRTDMQTPLEEVVLISDGKSVNAVTSGDEVVDLLANGQGVFAIAVGKVYQELQGQVAEIRAAEDASEQTPADAAPAADRGVAGHASS
jgi:DNA-binding transcriptional MerR regulator